MTDKPVWLLDVDGVLNAVSRDMPNTHPAESWHHDEVNASGTYYAAFFPIWWSEVVRDFIVEMSDLVDIRWHTTWQEAAQNLADVMGLPTFPVAECPEFHYERMRDYPQYGYGGNWWKMDTALRVVNEEERTLIWTDDDLGRWEVKAFQENLTVKDVKSLLVTPSTNVGLSPNNLKGIRSFVSNSEKEEVSTSS